MLTVMRVDFCNAIINSNTEAAIDKAKPCNLLPSNKADQDYQRLTNVTVSRRDAQIQEKKHMLQEEEEEERALDLQMEIDRLRALEAYEEREQQRMAESRVGAQILNEQIVERKREREHQEELRDLVSVPPTSGQQSTY